MLKRGLQNNSSASKLTTAEDAYNLPNVQTAQSTGSGTDAGKKVSYKDWQREMLMKAQGTPSRSSIGTLTSYRTAPKSVDRAKQLPDLKLKNS